MDSRQRADLDNYITGHYGEDQFRDAMECMNGHESAFYGTPMSEAYSYDPTDDGPEAEAITRILAAHTSWDLDEERWESRLKRYAKELGYASAN